MDRFEVIRKTARAALRLRDAELQKRLAALQAEAVLRLEETTRRWRWTPESADAMDRPGALSFRKGAFWLKEGAIEEGPLCPGCWGRAHGAVLMLANAGTWTCPACNRET
jgi:hypothetical protein